MRSVLFLTALVALSPLATSAWHDCVRTNQEKKSPETIKVGDDAFCRGLC
jgi:hypothetical protein